MPDDLTVSWLKSHTTLIIGVLALAVTLYLGNLFLTHRILLAEQKADQTQSALDLQKETNSALAKASQENEARYESLLSKLTAQNNTLLQTIAQRNQTLGQAQQQIQTLPLNDVGLRWLQLLALSADDIQKTDNALLVNDSAARKTVTELEALPILREDLRDTQAIVANKDSQIGSLTEVRDGLKTQVVGLESQIILADKNCEAKINVIHAKARKSKFKMFVAGVVSGVIAALKLTI